MMSKRLLALLPLAAVAVGLANYAASGSQAAPAAGKSIANFTLTDPRAQKSVALADFKGKPVVVLFLGTECPINNNYMPRLAQFQKEYAAKGVQLLGVNSNHQDKAERVAVHAAKHEVPFPVLKDDGTTVADLFGAQRTPEVFVLNTDRKVCYRGRIDDQFGVGFKRGQPNRNDLKEAIDEILAGKAVSEPETPVAGCLISRAVQPKAGGTVTYTQHVARILQNNCQECHRPGQIGPFALLTYDDAAAWSAMIREVVSDGRMPPWFADPSHGKFANDRSLSKADKDTLLAWVEQGCPKGDVRDLPPSRDFPEGWVIGKPDAIFHMPLEFDVPADTPKGGVPYKHYSVETNFKEDKWVSAAEARPGAPEVVHHIIVFIVPPGQGFNPNVPGMKVLCGTAPGDMPYLAPKGFAKKIPAGSKLVFQMHYTPNGKAQKDRSYCGLIFSKEPVERQILTMPIGNPAFAIPPGDDNYQVESRFVFRDDAKIISFMPHMHLRGKDFRYEAIYPDGKKETLLSVPRYNFNWQSVYRLEKPLTVPKGTTLHCVAHFDNSTKNPNNPDPTKRVTWGDQTWQEMMIGWTDFVYERKAE